MSSENDFKLFLKSVCFFVALLIENYFYFVSSNDLLLFLFFMFILAETLKWFLCIVWVDIVLSKRYELHIWKRIWLRIYAELNECLQ